jgi:hypothetical protein
LVEDFTIEVGTGGRPFVEFAAISGLICRRVAPHFSVSSRQTSSQLAGMKQQPGEIDHPLLSSFNPSAPALTSAHNPSIRNRTIQLG